MFQCHKWICKSKYAESMLLEGEFNECTVKVVIKCQNEFIIIVVSDTFFCSPSCANTIKYIQIKILWFLLLKRVHGGNNPQ